MRASDELDDRQLPAKPGIGAPAAALGIMGTVSVVHAIRGAPIDAVLWAAVTLIVSVEQLLLRRYADPRPETGDQPARGWPLLTVGAAVVCAGGLFAARSSVGGWPLRAMVLVLGLVVLARVFSTRAPAGQAGRGAPSWPWPTLLVLICLVELASFVQQPNLHTGSTEHPTLSVLIDPVLTSPTVRGLAFGAWLLAGIYLLRRAGLLGAGR